MKMKILLTQFQTPQSKPEINKRRWCLINLWKKQKKGRAGTG
jgi:hypothetical protein